MLVATKISILTPFSFGDRYPTLPVRDAICLLGQLCQWLLMSDYTKAS